jgi:hypothetical protein
MHDVALPGLGGIDFLFQHINGWRLISYRISIGLIAKTNISMIVLYLKIAMFKIDICVFSLDFSIICLQ